MISVIIVNFRAYPELNDCLDSLVTSQEDLEVIVIDNGSLKNEFNALSLKYKGNGRFRFYPKEDNPGFPAAANLGYKYSSGEILLFLNPDIVAGPNTLKMALDYFNEDAPGVLGCMHLSPDQRVQISFGYFPTLSRELKWKRLWNLRDSDYDLFTKRIAAFLSEPVEVDWVSGSFMMISRKLFEETGGFNEEYFMYFEDIELCRKVKYLKKNVVFNPKIHVLHYHGKSAEKNKKTSRAEYRKSQLNYYRKFNNFFQNCILKLYLWFNRFENV
ncbi:MAG: glycosyltransferase family 2 protein [bacterium]|nr:glycosyltransferase family 2 protein [bacterium]